MPQGAVCEVSAVCFRTAMTSASRQQLQSGQSIVQRERPGEYYMGDFAVIIIVITPALLLP